MIDRNIIDLIHRDLEGDLTQEEHLRLIRTLEENPEAGRYYREWQQLQQQMIHSGEISADDVNVVPDILRHLSARPATETSSARERITGRVPGSAPAVRPLYATVTSNIYHTMKKQTKIVIGVVAVIAAIVVVVVLLSPSVQQNLLTGSFGKAEKYRNTQMSEEDILLRSEFTKDTAQLHQMISGLIYFTLFTENLTQTIDSCLMSFRYQGFDRDPANTQTIALLEDYNSYLKNNAQTIAQTTKVLADIYLDDTTSLSMDIDQQLRDFAVFVDQVNRKDSVLMQSLASLDHFLVGNEKLQQNQEEIRKLKSIRDLVVIRSAQFLAMTNNKTGLGNVMSYALQSQDMFNRIELGSQMSAAGNLSASTGQVQSSGNLSGTMSGMVESLQSGYQSVTTSFGITSDLSSSGGTLSGKPTGDLSMIIYTSSSLSFQVCSVDQLNTQLSAAQVQSVLSGTDPVINSVAYMSHDVLGVFMSTNVLSSILQSQALSSYLSAAQLNIIIPAMELSQAGSLQGTLCNSPELQNVVNSSILQSIQFGSSSPISSIILYGYEQ